MIIMLDRYLVLDFASGGDLFGVYSRKKFWGDINKTRFYVASVIQAMEYLHERFIVYRDLKPENVVISAFGQAKLSDMGFAKELGCADGRSHTFCGTMHYLSPEMILSQEYEPFASKPVIFVNYKLFIFRSL